MPKTSFTKWSVSLPEKLSKAAEKRAAEESRTRSELIREALRSYLGNRETEMEESPQLEASVIRDRMAATGLYSEKFLEDLEDAIAYADKGGQ